MPNAATPPAASAIAAETLMQLARHYAAQLGGYGATPEQAVAVLEQNWAQVVTDASRLYAAALEECGE